MLIVYHPSRYSDQIGYHEAGTPECGATYPMADTPDHPWVCSRPVGHDGPHAHHGPRPMYAAWD